MGILFIRAYKKIKINEKIMRKKIKKWGDEKQIS
jgi:hypothetical protein